MQFEDTYNEILKIAQRLTKPRSFSNILALLKTDGMSSKTLFDSITTNFDDLLASFIIIRTKLISQLGVTMYQERETVATLLSMYPAPIDPTVVNKIFEQKRLNYRLPQALSAEQAQLVHNVVVANSCVEICRIGNMAERIYEIAFYAKYYLFLDIEKIDERHKEFSETMKFTMDNILDIPAVKKKVLETLGKYGRLSGMIQDDSIDTMFHILDREIAAMEVVLKAKQTNQQIDPNNVTEYVTLWLLTIDFKKRSDAIYERFRRETGPKTAPPTRGQTAPAQ